MSGESSHNELIRTEFTRQAAAYAGSPVVTDRDRIARLVQAARPAADARVLEVATGPGHIALAFAPHCAEVVGIDITEAFLDLAEQRRTALGLTNVRFQSADATVMPFAAQSFDLVVCRFAFHHFEQPERVLSEMARVCRGPGRIVVEDLTASEHPDRAAYYNHFEQLRDPSHTAALPLSKLLLLFTASGMEVESVLTDVIVQEVERWLNTTHTPAERRREIYRLIERDAAGDLSGALPAQDDHGRWYFRQRTALIVARPLSV